LIANPPPWKVEPRRDLLLGDGRTVVLRPLLATDANLIEEFFGSLSEREIYYFYQLDADAARRLAHGVGRDPAYRLVAVGELGGSEKILGYLFLHWGDSELPTFGACLRDGAQSAGLGRAMIDLLLASAAASGVSRARLTVHPDNWRALRLYQRFGFRLVDEFVNRHQRVKQYRMEADLLAPRPSIDDRLTIVPVGDVGVGLAAARLQNALAARTGRLPLLLDRPGRGASRVFFVVDLGSVNRFPIDGPALPATEDVAWVTALDARHVLLAGSGVPALERSVTRYLDRLAGEGNVDEATAGFRGVSGHRDL
jgi:ribosomal protein S18 acetylase RimI-like enzyme